MLNNSSEEKKADARLEQVLDAIKNQDKAALKAMFSNKALVEAEDINGSIDYLLTFVQGKIESWERDRLSSGESMGGAK